MGRTYPRDIGLYWGQYTWFFHTADRSIVSFVVPEQSYRNNSRKSTPRLCHETLRPTM
eukprot:CAMPEP_0178880264 /NCGR_PEP_ID=MMETSP0747-20121128/12377_1 /TAXON_ID=913974 /ORGANISM="Nitzschia punctata, Strain CCMP561" /LENGTH=57 /DNA_ID=CAMNT_0020548159 /DNA_START=464 /DNA_END=637 /DNA_ORIENTATION=+